ncbi:MAG TPA: hypothetical protein VFE62_07630 [Gemmataceae bacterium]|nr:hypothetical protein [Gemmataceae bacterium]
MERVDYQELTYDSPRNDGVLYYRGAPFTGVARLEDPGNCVFQETEFRGGVEWGLQREWHPTGQLKGETQLVRGVRHGPRRAWGEDGRLLIDEVWEWGVCVTRRRWDVAGEEVESFVLQPGDPAYAKLPILRRIAEQLDREDPPGAWEARAEE